MTANPDSPNHHKLHDKGGRFTPNELTRNYVKKQAVKLWHSKDISNQEVQLLKLMWEMAKEEDEGEESIVSNDNLAKIIAEVKEMDVCQI